MGFFLDLIFGSEADLAADAAADSRTAAAADLVGRRMEGGPGGEPYRREAAALTSRAQRRAAEKARAGGWDFLD